MHQAFDHTIYYQVCGTKFRLEIKDNEIDDYLDQLNAVDAEFINGEAYDNTANGKVIVKDNMRLSYY